MREPIKRSEKSPGKKLAQFSFPPSKDVSKIKQRISDCQLLSELPESIEVDGARGGNGEQAKASSGENILGICFPLIFALKGKRVRWANWGWGIGGHAPRKILIFNALKFRKTTFKIIDEILNYKRSALKKLYIYVTGTDINLFSPIFKFSYNDDLYNDISVTLVLLTLNQK